MKIHNYANALVAKAKEEAQNLGCYMKLGLASGTTAAMVTVPTMVCFAEETPGTNLLQGETLTVIQQGFANLTVTATAVIVMAMTAAVGVMLLSQACDYALKRMKAAFRKAA